jgi:hypothetical protein
MPSVYKIQDSGAQANGNFNQHAKYAAGRDINFHFTITESPKIDLYKKYFRLIKPLTKLNHFDIMQEIRGNEEEGYFEYYFKRKADKKLYATLSNRDTQNNCFQSVLILDKPLAGKTRAVWNVIKSIIKNEDFKNAYFIIPKQVPFDCDFEIPIELLTFPIFIFLDDIQQYVEYEHKQQINFINEYFFRYLFAQTNVSIIATCRRGAEYNLIEQRIGNELLIRLIPIGLGDIYEDQINIIKENVSNILSQKTDSSKAIGSLFIPVKEKQKRYKAIKNPLHKSILRGLKVCYILKYHRNMFFLESFIKDYCYKYYVNFCPFEWTEAINWLVENHFFIYHENGFIQIDEIYFDEVIEPKLKNIDSIVNEILEFFPIPEFANKLLHLTKREDLPILIKKIERKNISLDSHSYGILINKAENYKEAINIFNNIPTNLNLSNIIYNSLIDKSPEYKTAIEIYQKMMKNGVEADLFTFTILIKKTPDFKNAFDFYKKANEKDLFIYYSIIAKCETFEHVKIIFDEIMQNNVRIDEFIFNILLQKCEKYEQAKYIFDRLQITVSPNEYIYTTILGKCQNFNQAIILFRELIQKGIKLNIFIYNTLLNKCSNFKFARNIFNELLENGVSPNEVTYSILLNKCKTYDQALSFFDELLQKDVFPNEVIYNTLLNKCDNFKQAKIIFDHYIPQYFKNNIFVYNTLLQKSESLEQAIIIFDEIFRKNITPDKVSYTIFLNKCENFEKAIIFFEELIENNLILNNHYINILLKKAKNIEQKNFVFEIMKKHNIKPDIITYNTLLKKSESIEDALNIYDNMKKANLSYYNEFTFKYFNKYLNKSANFDILHSLNRKYTYKDLFEDRIFRNIIHHFIITFGYEKVENEYPQWQSLINNIILLKKINKVSIKDILEFIKQLFFETKITVNQLNEILPAMTDLKKRFLIQETINS